MCLILFSLNQHANSPLVLAANRDEFFARPTEPAHFWNDHPKLLAGKDLTAGGTWLGITRSGRFAAVTNVREPDIVVENPLSRGKLTLDFLSGTQAPDKYLEGIRQEQERYPGFNLLLGRFNGNAGELFYFSNRQGDITPLEPGTYGLSNHLLDTPWPKVASGTEHLAQLDQAQDHNQLRAIIENPTLADDDALPATGVSYQREKMLSASFIISPDYGTRSSSVITIKQQRVNFSEQRYIPSSSQQPNRNGAPKTIEFMIEQ